jgi:hypothetical membrane protein
MKIGWPLNGSFIIFGVLRVVFTEFLRSNPHRVLFLLAGSTDLRFVALVGILDRSGLKKAHCLSCHKYFYDFLHISLFATSFLGIAFIEKKITRTKDKKFNRRKARELQ